MTQVMHKPIKFPMKILRRANKPPYTLGKFTITEYITVEIYTNIYS